MCKGVCTGMYKVMYKGMCEGMCVCEVESNYSVIVHSAMCLF